MTAPTIDIQVMIDEIKLIGLGAADWLERAKKGEIKRPPEAIERRVRRLMACERR